MGNTKKITAALVAASCLSLPQTAAADGFKYYDVGLGTVNYGGSSLFLGDVSAAYEFGQLTLFGEGLHLTDGDSSSSAYEIGAQYQFENNLYVSASYYVVESSESTSFGIGYSGDQFFASADILSYDGGTTNSLLLGYEFGGVSSSAGTTEVAVRYLSEDGYEGFFGYLNSDFGQFGLDVDIISDSDGSVWRVTGSYDVNDRLTLKAGVTDLDATYFTGGITYEISDRVSLSAGAMDLDGATAYRFGLNLNFQEKSLRDLRFFDLSDIYTDGVVPLF